MSVDTALLGLGVLVALYAIAIAALIVAGRRTHAIALARFIPDAIILTKRLASDPRVPRRTRWILGGVAVYLAIPIDLIPDFVPVAGQLDDVIIVGLALRAVVRAAGPDLIRELWPGPPEGLAAVLRVTGPAPPR